MIQSTTQEMADTSGIGSSAFVHGGGDGEIQRHNQLKLLGFSVRKNKSSQINLRSLHPPWPTCLYIMWSHGLIRVNKQWELNDLHLPPVFLMVSWANKESIILSDVLTSCQGKTWALQCFRLVAVMLMSCLITQGGYCLSMFSSVFVLNRRKEYLPIQVPMKMSAFTSVKSLVLLKKKLVTWKKGSLF